MAHPDRDRVIALFEASRAKPGAHFKEHNFLDYLIADPQVDRAAYGSFQGLRRLNRFIEAVQLEYSICFSMNDRDANYSLDAFIGRINELRNSSRSSLASLQNREKHSFGWPAVIFANLLAFPLWVLGFKWAPVIGWCLVAACLGATGLAVRLYLLDRAYLKRLRAQLEGRQRHGI